MSKKIYLSPERRPAPHGPYFGHPGVWEHDVTVRIAEKTAAALCRWTIPADNFLSISARFAVLYNRPVKKKTR